MRFLHDRQVICIIYDGIKNSVFKSQVLQPLLNELDANINLTITLLSFERKMVNVQAVIQHDRIRVIFAHRLPFWGKISLLYAWLRCITTMRGMSADCIIARGPLAGYIAMSMIKWGTITTERCIIQARGLCAQEYRYVHSKKKQTLFQRAYQPAVYHSLEAIERNVYALKSKKRNCGLNIEAVSPALKKYLIEYFNADADQITIAQDDFMRSLTQQVRQQARIEIRQTLSIGIDRQIYCYSGSYKPWQCVDLMLSSFVAKSRDDQRAFLLILTPDVLLFSRALEQTIIESASYMVLNVATIDLLNYLCAADYGFMLREDDIINWVSRPTKMLEYQAAGVSILHNKTIAWLVEQERGKLSAE